MSGMASVPEVDLTSTGSGYPYYAERHVPTGELVRREATLSDKEDAIDKMYDAWSLPEGKHQDPSGCPTWYDYCHCTSATLADQIERAEKAERELAEIKRVLIAFHRQEGDGIVSVKRLAKRLSESASQAELSPAGTFSPTGLPSSRGLTKEEGEAYEGILRESFGGTE